ncbi:MAG TPA: excinuclease ABC subunit UvrA [Gemmatimonadales bacterium]|nr:excinuclease ABC subunit UvrA [Gemmatimonadales bacterium]
MPRPVIRVVNARQHNLKGITVEIPRRTFTVVTGPSGCGKSSLAFDTLYAEGQRRYIESLSTYAKQFLERMPKPLVDHIDGIAPAVAIEQRAPTMSSRSTVGTATEVYDYLRLLWARIGEQFCIVCGGPVRRDTPESAADAIVALGAGRVQIAFPLPATARVTHAGTVDNLRALGFVRLLVDGTPQHLDELDPALDLVQVQSVLVVVDRLTSDITQRGRLSESVSTAFVEGEGIALALREDGVTQRFTEHPACSRCDTPAPTITPALFSFNNPRGACPTCNGFGATLEYDLSLIVPDPERSVEDGAIDPWTKPRYEARRRLLVSTARKLGADPTAPWRTLSADVQETLLRGKTGKYLGIFPFLVDLERKRYKQYIRVFLRQYQLAHECSACHGARLRPEALAVRVAGATIATVSALTVDALAAWFTTLELSASARQIADLVLAETDARIDYLRDVGLGYLTLDRQTRTLSGGEAQRIALSNALGSRLVDSIYVLDEPSIGLHPRDTDRLLALLRRLRDLGNTLIVVEHDLAAIRGADWMIELGPGAGEFGGKVMHSGPVSEATNTLTADYLTHRKRIGVPSLRRPAAAPWLKVHGARLHNLAGVDVAIPLGTLTAVIGVSGSGKSTLVYDVIYRQLERLLQGEHSARTHLGEVVGDVDTITGWELLSDVVLIDQSPIGRTPRSNPVTYIKAYDEIRELFARQPLARDRKYTPSTFSFNVAGGRCDNCDGAGYTQVEMVFLADVFVPCEVCGGTRFKREVLDVRVQGYSIADVLQWSVDDAIRRFHHQTKLGAALWQLQQVGLGYLRLGQPANTLSGGEAQRLKIARELLGAEKRRGRKLYLLDEPTTGLHLDDVRILIGVLDKLVDAGHTVVVVEHQMDVVKRADWVIEMGPEAGPAGGRVVAMGTPEAVAATRGSHTAPYLREALAVSEMPPLP